MALVIKKKVNLESLGEEYKGIEITFRSIPAKDLPEISEEGKTANEDTTKLIPMFISVLQKYFLAGTQEGEELTKEDIEELDTAAILECFQILTGQKLDPKSSGTLTNTSPTEV